MSIYIYPERAAGYKREAVMLLLRLSADGVMIVVLQAASGDESVCERGQLELRACIVSGLDAAVFELRQREMTEHEVGAAWLEQQCVSVDVCKQVSSNRDPVFSQPMPAMAGVWLNVNSSALSLQGSAQKRAEAEAGVRAYNQEALEFARVPEGLRVETCSPDFDLARRTGRIACDETTVRRLEADDTARACPGEVGFSLLDCVKPLQHDAETTQLFRRAAHEKAHFGSLSRAEACGGAEHLEHLPEVAAQLCRDLDEYSVDVPGAARMHESLMRSLGHQKLPNGGARDDEPGAVRVHARLRVPRAGGAGGQRHGAVAQSCAESGCELSEHDDIDSLRAQLEKSEAHAKKLEARLSDANRKAPGSRDSKDKASGPRAPKKADKPKSPAPLASTESDASA
jgi:hypothetical protein